MVWVFTGIFIAAALAIGGERTAKSLITLGQNAILLLLTIYLIYLGLNPLIVTVAACIIISLITLFYQNEVNAKTKTAFLSVMIVILLVFGLIVYLTVKGNLQGFPLGQYFIREGNGFKANININMTLVQISVVLMTLIGAVVDTALAITSALFEVHTNNKHLNSTELFSSGISIGKDILSSTINTLFFIFVGEYFVLFINFSKFFTFSRLINSKDFTSEVITIAISAIGCILIIPLASFISGKAYAKTQYEID